jgi:proteic killer suppression protein
LAIRSFKDRRTEAIFRAKRAKGVPPDVLQRARSRLFKLHSAASLGDLALPPSNRLEALAGNRAGQYSIRVNDQWRICFRWIDGGAEDVTFVDYH